jgi:hypothetical protein
MLAVAGLVVEVWTMQTVGPAGLPSVRIQTQASSAFLFVPFGDRSVPSPNVPKQSESVVTC